MANNLITAVGITRTALEAFQNSYGISKTFNRALAMGHFGDADPKEGNTLKVRLPNDYNVYNTLTYQDQYVEERTIDFIINTPLLVPLSLSPYDFELDLDDFDRTFSTPAAMTMSGRADFLGAGLYYKIWNQIGDETSLPTVDDFFDAAAILRMVGVVQNGEWHAVVNPYAAAAILKESKGQFNPTSDISKQYRDGIIGRTAGFTWLEEQNIRTHDTGNYGSAATLQANLTEGATSITINNFTDLTGTATIKSGDVFTIEGVYELNYQNKQKTGRIQQFTALADATAVAGILTVLIAPIPYWSTDNPWRNVSNGASAGAVISWDALQNSSYSVNLAYANDTFFYAPVTLSLPKMSEMAHVETYEGYSMRFVRTWDDVDAGYRNRLDMLMAQDCLRGGRGVRIKSQANVPSSIIESRYPGMAKTPKTCHNQEQKGKKING